MPKPVTIQSPLDPLTLCSSSVYTRSISRNITIEAVPLVGCMLYNDALSRNFILALGSYTNDPHQTKKFCCLYFSQAVIPLSYAAQIPTTPDPDLANVRLFVQNYAAGLHDHHVPQSVFLCVCVRERERKRERERLCTGACVRVRESVGV